MVVYSGGDPNVDTSVAGAASCGKQVNTYGPACNECGYIEANSGILAAPVSSQAVTVDLSPTVSVPTYAIPGMSGALGAPQGRVWVYRGPSQPDFYAIPIPRDADGNPVAFKDFP